MFRTLIFAVTLCALCSQKLTPKAMKGIFKYADPKLVEQLTKSLNGDKNVAAQQKRLSNWAPDNALGVNSGEGEKALDVAKSFMEHRAAVKKNNKFVLTSLRKDLLGKKMIKKIQKLSWATDKANNNDFDATRNAFIPKLMKTLPNNKKNAVMEEVKKIQAAFGKQQPKEAAALMGYKKPT